MFPLIISDGSFQASSQFPHMHMPVSTQVNTGGSCFRDLQVFLCAAVFSCTLCRKLELPLSPQTLHSIPSALRVSHALSGFPLPMLWVRNSQGSMSQNSSVAHFINFLFCRDYCPLLPDVPCLANYGFLYLVHFVGCFRQESKADLYYSIVTGNGSLVSCF